MTWSPNTNFGDLTAYLTYYPHTYSDFFECVTGGGCKLHIWHSGREGVDPIATFLSLLSLHMCVFLPCLEELLTPPPLPPILPLSPHLTPFPHLFPHMHYCTYIYDCVDKGPNVRPQNLKGGMFKHLCLRHFLNAIISYVWHWHRMIIKALFF